MSYKIFPKTFDNDQLIIEFDYKEEKNAFERVLKSITDKAESNKPRHEAIEDYEFNSILDMKVAMNHVENLRRIIGLVTLNINHRFSVIIVPLSEYSIKHKTYWFSEVV
ncbi:MAG: hypothetical protein NTY12_00705 [Candidatus Falkowbacteria bacterium]|nr:hypothetical protein [Candidatus Falkowbacteria bacterium]